MKFFMYKVLLENTAEGKALATVLELPECQITADTTEAALFEVQQQLNHRLASAEVVLIKILSQGEHPMLKFAGIFKGDPDFAGVVANIAAERTIIETSN
jgi:predicted RNase H-like HicB family nuclease